MSASATPVDENRKTTVATGATSKDYAASKNLAVRGKSQLPYKQFFKKPINSVKSTNKPLNHLFLGQTGNTVSQRV